ncbi:MAG: DUF6285 domain-containing protein [Gammaproteobacteria bacterium]
MAHDQPDVPDMVLTAREFLADLVPRLDGLDRYHALCTVYLLDIARRELDEWTHDDTPDDEHLRALTGASGETQPATVVADLCRAIRSGRFDADLAGLREALLEHVVAKVRVVKPSVLVPEHRSADAIPSGETRE